ncbi:MAG TPA: cytochrome P450 [Rhodospirillaceae bacterium]|nr:cytochrome P450 [Rhodospirillaceae bacterium]
MTKDLYRPPAPMPIGPVMALMRSLIAGDRDLLALIPKQAYHSTVAPLGYSRRKIILVNDPAAIRRVMIEEVENFPKSDLMVGSLSPLINDGLFVSAGATWSRQRAMVDPAFTHMRVNRAFDAMVGAVADIEARWDILSDEGKPLSLEREMSHLTADIITRTIFSQKLENSVAFEFFDAWASFQDSVATIDLKSLILGKAWAPMKQPPAAQKAARVIRSHLGQLVDQRMEPEAPKQADIVGDLIAARDPVTGTGFSREEIIDQVGVFFLAGHETTASALTWTFFILSQQPEMVQRLRDEVQNVAGSGGISFAVTKKLATARNVFRESLRLYPPLGFIPRVSLFDTVIQGVPTPRGAMVMISPWIIHRHEGLWEAADRFDPDRFMPDREQTQPPGAYIPFGLGPRICIGAAFATVEAVLILSRLIRRYDFETSNPQKVRPISHLATRPAGEIEMHVVRRREGK